MCVGKARSSNRLTIALNDSNSEVGYPFPTQVKARFQAVETENPALVHYTKPLARQGFVRLRFVSDSLTGLRG